MSEGISSLMWKVRLFLVLPPSLPPSFWCVCEREGDGDCEEDAGDGCVVEGGEEGGECPRGY